jgi:ribose transport system ATP-binding protein
MEELIGMSDRIIVLAENKMTGELRKEEFDSDRIMAYASGITDGGSATLEKESA